MATKGKTIRCKGAVCWKRGEPLVIEEVDVAPPQPSEVRIKIICTSLCHSDVTFWTLPEPAGVFPRILGHEAVGIVESVGEGVREFKEGDMVVPSLLADCEECVGCKSEKSNICATFPFSPLRTGMPRDGSSRLSTASGQRLHHFLNVSSFVEYTVLDVTHLVKVDPADVPPEKACLLGCGVSTGVGAAWRAAGVEMGSKVAIFGLGSVGLAVAEGARLRGASQIIGVDLNPDKHEIGKKFGVTDFINPKECGDKSLSQVVMELTGGGADYCFECVGLASLMSEAYSSSRPGRGKTVILGVEMNGAPFCIGSGELLQGRTVVGSLFGGVKPKTDIPNFARLYKRKELQLDDFITHEVSLHEINQAFELLTQGKSLRCIIWMDKPTNRIN
ncbi:alcohol dehydrogenase-like 2 [Nymphaea colorata]|nr:alcohol dehydrogenase-like 2 [Nymphaea colorata]